MRPLLAALVVASVPRASSFLYNITADPYELTDLSLNSAYAGISTLLKSQLSFYAAQNGPSSLQDASAAGPVFKIAGGVVPYLDYPNVPPAIIRAGHATPSAPNLVFILLDDLG